MNKPHESAPAERLLRLPEVKHLTGLGKSAVYDQMSEGRFPRCVKIGRTSVWPSSEVNAWIAARIREGKASLPTARPRRTSEAVAA
ncbi:MAG: AlpA family phage regulatory protein [Proteobacteria bacterium]|nr:AlpA family phage regulatory protein [Pseudomonadota bacterium]